MTKFAELGGFLIGSLVEPFAADRTNLAGEEKKGKTLDIHVHLVGNGDAGSGCRISKRFADRVVFKVLMRRMRVWERAPTFDEGYVSALAELLRDSSLDKAAVMAEGFEYRGIGR